jgi:hypothetical protein
MKMADPSSVSPEQLSRLKDILEAVSAHGAQSASWRDDLTAVGDFIGHAGWPIVVLTALVMFRGPISRLRRFAYKDVQVEIDQALVQAGQRAALSAASQKGVPTAEDVAQAGQVASLAAGLDLEALRRSANTLAADYERVRASMPSSDERTRRMEVCVAKMRTLGRAVIPLRHEFMSGTSPGQRLVAIASFQVAPDFEWLGWLVDRLQPEKPFVSYHAAVALSVAARDPRGANHVAELNAARARIQEIRKTIPPDAGRDRTLGEFVEVVGNLAATP